MVATQRTNSRGQAIDANGRFVKAEKAWYETYEDEAAKTAPEPLEPSYVAIHNKYYLVWAVSTGIGMFAMLLIGKYYGRFF